MDADLNEIAVFVKVVELGSFSRAAKQLNMPNSTVSAKVSGLEKRLGMSLIRRTTRKLFVTQEGRTFFERCTRSLDEIRAAEDEITSGQREPQGLLRVTAPVEFGGAVLPPVIEKFKQQHPKVKFDLFLTDRSVDLITEGFDLAIRAGDLKDSSLISKKLGDIYFAPFASPAYLKKTGMPRSPKDLQERCCLQFPPLGLQEWKLLGPKTVSIPMQQQIVINELNLIKALTVSGMGVSLLPTFLCFPEVRAGKLVRILPEWRSNLRPVSFVYGGQRIASAKVSAFISVAQEEIKSKLQAFEF